MAGAQAERRVSPRQFAIGVAVVPAAVVDAAAARLCPRHLDADLAGVR